MKNPVRQRGERTNITGSRTVWRLIKEGAIIRKALDIASCNLWWRTVQIIDINMDDEGHAGLQAAMVRF